MTPFEVFRTPIQIRRFTQGFYLDGIWQEGSRVKLGGLLVSGNVINITFNGAVFAPIAFTVSAAATMELIRLAFLAEPNVQQVDISDDLLFITIVPLQPFVSVVNSFTITGGASQPSVLITNSPEIIAATASVQPLGKDVKLVPEGRRNAAQFKFYTSTEIYGVTTQNPDQVTVLKAPFTGLVYEVINISDWQNNSNFDIINHYKFVALTLRPLPGVG
jgi:hypothetical protein